MVSKYCKIPSLRSQMEKLNDIALLKLSRSTQSELPLPLCQSDNEGQYQIAICGLGVTNITTGEYARVLQELKVTELPEDNCPYDVEKSQICMNGSTVAGDFCVGDSGGPAYALDGDGNPLCLYGIMSNGWWNCSYFSYYTRIPYFLDWIESKMQ
ncbi:CLIP domain-containing serine protease HP8-like [Convolutriloba macropyga]|uniref:CLIP domain-containing serine protease HP8-like n=1 Tax=Convolutriloba macropyga TaxID=536237 RepID=UPI003F52614D